MGGLQNITIRRATREDLQALYGIAAKMRSGKEIDYFERNLTEQGNGRREILMALWDGQPVAYCIFNWEPKYGYFKSLSIAETQDLNVLPDFRRRGIASAVIAHCENLARAKGHAMIGISYSVSAAYGPAQVLYTKLGYVPDGQGVTFDRRVVSHGEFRPVDENLCLMMVKSL